VPLLAFVVASALCIWAFYLDLMQPFANPIAHDVATVVLLSIATVIAFAGCSTGLRQNELVLDSWSQQLAGCFFGILNLALSLFLLLVLAAELQRLTRV
jgi:hypothetical protein